MTEDDDHDGAIATAIAYHERTKHFPGRYARSLGHLDWATQPDPFRRFEGAPLVALDQIEPSAEHGASLPRVLAGEVAPPAPLDRRFVSQLFYDSLALSAWKEHGAARWSLRVNPSSGNLHPTEGYWLSGPVDDLLETATVCHYAPHEHALEVRRVLTEAEWSTLASQLPSGAALIALSSIHWREAWKYGERAFRYCHHDVGHAIAAVAIAASTLGWCVRMVEGVADAELARLIGIDSQSGPEAEHADALLALFPDAGGAVHQPFDVPTLVGQWQGKPLPLSPDHVEWPVIDDVARAVRKRESPRFDDARPSPASRVFADGPPARALVRRRRSAVDFDAASRMSRQRFYDTLASTLPAAGAVPFASLPWGPRIHFGLFVHRVDDVEPGFYFFARHADAVDSARSAFREQLLWERAPELDAGMDLYLLIPADVRDAAKLIACHQDIASHGAFSLGMLAEFEPTLRAHGALMYPRLHWEAGAIGQVLYLQAEASGLGGTGIGCFFDDVMHDLLGLADRQFQTLYHFTIGGPVDDPRVRSSPAYAHRRSCATMAES